MGYWGSTIANLINLLREPIQILLKRRLCRLRALATKHRRRNIRRLFLQHSAFLQSRRRRRRAALAFLCREHQKKGKVKADVVVQRWGVVVWGACRERVRFVMGRGIVIWTGSYGKISRYFRGFTSPLFPEGQLSKP
jgi:hypothetical protein